MRITQWGEYGIHFSAYMARREREGAPMVSAGEIASRQGVDIQYAQQILQRLRRGGIIDSVRGPAGGYRLARPPLEITLRDILTATEGGTFEVICENKPLGGERCAPGTACGLRGLWFELQDHVNVFLMRHTLDELSRMPSYTFAETSPHSAEDAPVQIGSGHSVES